MKYVFAHYLIASCLLCVAAITQFINSDKDKKYKEAVYKVDVLAKISEQYVPTIENLAKINQNILTIKHFLDWERGLENKTYALAKHFSWHNTVSDQRKEELEVAKSAFFQNQNVALEIILLDTQHPGIIPVSAIKWANETSGIKFEEIESILDTMTPVGQRPKESVMSYYKLTGEAFGAVIGTINLNSKLISGEF